MARYFRVVIVAAVVVLFGWTAVPANAADGMFISAEIVEGSVTSTSFAIEVCTTEYEGFGGEMWVDVEGPTAVHFDGDNFWGAAGAHGCQTAYATGLAPGTDYTVSVAGGYYSFGLQNNWVIASTTPPFTVATLAAPFVDVDAGNPFYDDILWLASSGISTGSSVGGGRYAFQPGDAVSRQAMAAFLYRAAGSPSFTAPGVSPFVDVATSAPFYKEIAWLASTGISTGTALGGGKYAFQPGDAVSRQAMAAFLYRAEGSPSFTAPGASPFVDVPTSAPFYKEIAWLAASGISTGSNLGGGRYAFQPGDPVTRQAMAAFLHRASTL